MTDLEKLKFNLQERQAPYFNDEELQNLLDVHGEVWTASYYGCLMKAQSNDEIKLPGGLETKSNSEYWFKLAEVYKQKIPSGSSSDTVGYKTSMARVDGQ